MTTIFSFPINLKKSASKTNKKRQYCVASWHRLKLVHESTSKNLKGNDFSNSTTGNCEKNFTLRKVGQLIRHNVLVPLTVVMHRFATEISRNYLGLLSPLTSFPTIASKPRSCHDLGKASFYVNIQRNTETLPLVCQAWISTPSQ